MAMSPAEKQIQAIGDLERITRELVLVTGLPSSVARRAIEKLLHRDVIRVGQRPNVERPMEGQTTIDDALRAPAFPEPK